MRVMAYKAIHQHQQDHEKQDQGQAKEPKH